MLELKNKPMKKIVFVFTALVLFMIQSCSVETTTHFNRDYSGNVTSNIDISQMMGLASMGGGDDDAKKMDSLFMLFDPAHRPDSVKQKIAELNERMSEKGLDNFDFTASKDDQTVGLKFDFDNVKALSQANIIDLLGNSFDPSGANSATLGSADSEMMKLNGAVTVLGRKKVEIDLAGMSYDQMIEDAMKPDPEDPEDEGMTREEAEQMMSMMTGMMGSMFDVKQTYSFDRKIKKVECDLPFTQNKKSVTIKYTYGQMMKLLKEKKEVKMKIRLR